MRRHCTVMVVAIDANNRLWRPNQETHLYSHLCKLPDACLPSHTLSRNSQERSKWRAEEESLLLSSRNPNVCLPTARRYCPLQHSEGGTWHLVRGGGKESCGSAASSRIAVVAVGVRWLSRSQLRPGTEQRNDKKLSC